MPFGMLLMLDVDAAQKWSQIITNIPAKYSATRTRQPFPTAWNGT
jgi:hypothetical protein